MFDVLKRLISQVSAGRLFPEHDPRFERMSRKARLAALGEELASRELAKAGFTILERGWRWHRYELDIIARKGDVLVAAEVKTRSDDSFGSPQEAVPRWKQRRISRAAQAYMRQEKLHGCLLRFDIFAVTIPEGGHPEIVHLENAFSKV